MTFNDVTFKNIDLWNIARAASINPLDIEDPTPEDN
jgi:hypothetical protein